MSSELSPEHQAVENGPAVFDFRRPDRISAPELRAVELLHEQFVQNLAAGLSAYLRCNAKAALLAVEQLSYKDFLQRLASPPCVVALAVKPHEGTAVLELAPPLATVWLQMLLGGSPQTGAALERKITKIEQSVLDGPLRLFASQLRQSWQDVDFRIEKWLQQEDLPLTLGPHEPVVVISTEIRVQESVGTLRLALPALLIRNLRGKFDREWRAPQVVSGETSQARMLELVHSATVEVDALLEGPTVLVKDLMELAEGTVLQFHHQPGCALHCVINGKLKFKGQIVRAGNKRAFSIDEPAGNSCSR